MSPSPSTSAAKTEIGPSARGWDAHFAFAPDTRLADIPVGDLAERAGDSWTGYEVDSHWWFGEDMYSLLVDGVRRVLIHAGPVPGESGGFATQKGQLFFEGESPDGQLLEGVGAVWDWWGGWTACAMSGAMSDATSAAAPRS